MTPPTLFASVGVALLLVAFLCNLFRLMPADGNAYLALNLIGAGLACYSAYLVSFMPFIVLEGTWAVVAGVSLARKAFGHSAAGRGGAA